MASNITRYQTISRQMEIVDLWQSVLSAPTLQRRFSSHPQEVLTSLVPHRWRGYGLVLAWDLYNYLDRRQAQELSHFVARRCRPGAMLYALFYMASEMPAQPQHFSIVDEGSLQYRSTVTTQRQCPRTSSAEVESMLKSFEIEHSYLLRHGAREFLARAAHIPLEVSS